MANAIHTRQTLAIVGGGPRGLAALEQLAKSLDRGTGFELPNVLLFECNDFPGAGPNYQPTQAISNQLNIPLRSLPFGPGIALNGRLTLSAFPAFADWYRTSHWATETGWPGNDEDEDHYPPRAAVGAYLQARLQHLIVGLRDQWPVSMQRQRAVGLQSRGHTWCLLTDDGRTAESIDAVLLAVGHVDAAPDPALDHWHRHAVSHAGASLFAQPYPVEPLIHAPEISANSVVALRGMGLSMLDVIVALCQGRGGRFTIESADRCRYHPSGREPARLIPFSLDGLALAPKPLNALLDARYQPTDTQVRELIKRIESAREDASETLPDLLSAAVAEIADQQAARRDDGGHTQGYGADVDDAAPPVIQMRRFLAMAVGASAPSRDYCRGQVWRHLQPVIFRSLSHTHLPTDTVERVIDIHQQMKRFAFGPPVTSVRQALALHEAGILDFEVCDDPAITPIDGGWLLSESGDRIVADVMVDTVLDGPSLDAITDPLITQLSEAGHLSAMAEGLGVRTDATARVLAASGDSAVSPELTLLGRLATGSVIEADSLTESFGEPAERWADALLGRLKARNG